MTHDIYCSMRCCDDSWCFFNRYKAAQKRQEDSLCLPNTSISIPNCHELGAVSVHQHWLPKTDTDPALVFLCYQGYNHFTGKVFRPS